MGRSRKNDIPKDNLGARDKAQTSSIDFLSHENMTK